jgi:hypothetical protein
VCCTTGRSVFGWVWDTNNGSFEDVWMLVEQAFYLRWGDLKTFVFDELLLIH